MSEKPYIGMDEAQVVELGRQQVRQLTLYRVITQWLIGLVLLNIVFSAVTMSVLIKIQSNIGNLKQEIAILRQTGIPVTTTVVDTEVGGTADVTAALRASELAKLREKRRRFLMMVFEKAEDSEIISGRKFEYTDSDKEALMAACLAQPQVTDPNFPVISTLMILDNNSKFPYQIKHKDILPIPSKVAYPGRDSKDFVKQFSEYSEVFSKTGGTEAGLLDVLKKLDPKVSGGYPISLPTRILFLVDRALEAAGGEM